MEGKMAMNDLAREKHFQSLQALSINFTDAPLHQNGLLSVGMSVTVKPRKDLQGPEGKSP
jgi:hypothetical protein